MFALQIRMWLLLGALFAIIYAVVTMIGTSMGVTNFYVYLALSAVMMFIQYLIGPKIVEWTMRVKYVSREGYPQLYRMVEGLAQKAGLPMPRICIAPMALPNAFAFGRGRSDGRVCVTEGILRLLREDELRAVLGHELTHIKNRDVLTITLLSVIPIIMYRLAWNFLFFGDRRSGRNGSATALIGLAALIFYFITNLLVLYASRVREYFADRGSIEMGNNPSALASALYKLVYGAARTQKESLRETEGLKAFFINDPSRALNEIKELSALDLDKSGTIDGAELARLRSTTIRLSFADKLMEIFSTHPNMLKRIQQLSAARG